MKKLLTAFLLFFYVAPLSAVDYSTFQYADFFNLPRKNPMENLTDATNKIAQAITNVRPEQANNFIAFEQYKQYQELLLQVYKILQEKKSLPAPTKQDMSIKIAFDFFLLMQEQVKNNSLNASELEKFKKSIEIYTKKIGTSITIGKILTVLEGFLEIAKKQPLPSYIVDLLKIKNGELNNVFQEETGDKTQCFEIAIRQDFDYTYLDEKMRNNIVKEYLNLVEIFYTKTDKLRAERIVNNLKGLIQTQWGELFPIENSLKQQVTNFLQHQEQMKSFNSSLGEVLGILKKNLHVLAHKKGQELLKVIEEYEVDELFHEEINEIKKDLTSKLERIKNAIEQKNNASGDELEEFEKLKQDGKLAPTIELKETKTLEAIEIIDPYKNETGKVIELYNFLIKQYLDQKNLKKIDEYTKKAQIKIGKISQTEAVTVPGFEDAKNKFEQLRQQVEELKKPKPAPSPAPEPKPITTPAPEPKPSKELGQLNQMFIDLQTQFVILKKLMGG